MIKNMKRWISIMLMACLMAALSPAALMEAAPVEGGIAAGGIADGIADGIANGTAVAAEALEAEDADAEDVVAAPAEDVVVPEAEEMDLSLGDEDEVDLDAEAGEAGDADAAPVEVALMSVTEKPYAYAWTRNGGTGVYRDEALTDAVVSLTAGEAVLVVERLGEADRVVFMSLDGVVDGYVAASDLEEMCQADVDSLLDALAAIGGATLYEGDVDWPLPTAARGQLLAASDFKRISNDTQYVVQGKTITARMVGNHSDCWSWARALYKIIWGVKFGTDFVGDPVNGHSLIRNLTDQERLLTGENLKRFMKQSVVGCTLRICSCPRNCANIDHDGCSKHEKHSLMVVKIEEDGFVVMDNMTGSGSERYSTRYYTYDNFAKHWAKYKMVKYIKWPNAPEFDKSRDSGVKPERIALSETSLTVRAEQSCALSATVLPDNAEDKTVTWSSSDPFVAYMDKDGSLVAVDSGTATITATAANGVSASAKVTVVSKDYKATGVSLDQSGTVYLSLGKTLQLKATVEPAYANPAVAWKSSKKKVATVSSSGLVTPKKVGTTTITVITASKKKARVKVKVVKGSAPGKVTLDKTGTVTLNMGETLKLNATVTPATDNPVLKWKSSKKKVATVSSDGTVTPVSAGTAVIAVMTSNKKFAKVKVKVLDPDAPSKVTLDKTGIVTLKMGETLQLTPTLTPSTAKTSLTWKSSKKKVATVSSDGLVTPVKPGKCVIAVMTSNKKIAKVKVKVTK